MKPSAQPKFQLHTAELRVTFHRVQLEGPQHFTARPFPKWRRTPPTTATTGLSISIQQRNLAMIRAFDSDLGPFQARACGPFKNSMGADWFAGGPAGYIQPLTVFTPVAKQVEWLCGLGKVYLNTFPSNALAIARHVARNPETRPQLLAILTAGEP